MLKIKAVKFQDSESRQGNREIMATMDDGSDAYVFSYYDDELTFSCDELIGLTIDEARDLKQEKDIAYLRS